MGSIKEGRPHAYVPNGRRRRVLGIADVIAPCRVVPLVVDVEHREVGHESRRRRAMPMFLARLEKDAIAWTDHLDDSNAALRQAETPSDDSGLARGVPVPGGSCARREMDAARAQSRGT